MNLTIRLFALSSSLHEAWMEYCSELPDVEIHRRDIMEVRSDAIVSPANSYGFMDGGIDLVYTRFFGRELQRKLQNIIQQKHHGELLVGNAEIVETEHDFIPYLISAPTMRIPQPLGNSINPYLASRAVFLLIKHGIFEQGPDQGRRIAETIGSVSIPGLGTGAGEIDPRICAMQVRQAIKDVIHEEAIFPRSWLEAQERHHGLLRRI